MPARARAKATASGRAAVRRTQAERSTATRAALAEAAVDLLVERGWSAVTAVDVCDRAGLSRGAFHHHYPSLPALLADALRRLYAELSATTRRRARSADADLVGLVDGTWAAIGSPRFKAVVEAWLAMANDPGLRGEVGPVVAEFATLVSPASMAPGVLVDAERRDFYATAREAMLGLALGRATHGGRPLGHERRVLARLRAEAAALG